jgi:hypothetical protein
MNLPRITTHWRIGMMGAAPLIQVNRKEAASLILMEMEE